MIRQSLPLVVLAAALSASTTARALDLSEAMEQAAESHELVRAALLNEEAAQADARAASGLLLPTASLVGALIRNNREIVLGDRAFTNLYDYAGRVQVNIPLVRLDAISERNRQRALLEGAAAGTELQQADIRLAAARSYLAAVAARESLHAAHDRLALAQASLEQAEARLQHGFALPNDVTQLQVQVRLAEADVVRAELDQELAVANLAFMTNLPLDQVSAESLQQVDDIDHSLDALASQRDPQQLANELAGLAAVRAATAGMKTQRFAWAPTLDLVGQYNLGRPSVRAPNGTFWTISLNLNWVFFDMARVHRIQAAEAREAQAMVQLELVERANELQRQTAAMTRAANQATLAAVERQVDAAQTNELLQRQRFNAGDATALELTQAQTDLFQARVALALARLDDHLAEVDLLYAQGVLQGPHFGAPENK